MSVRKKGFLTVAMAAVLVALAGCNKRNTSGSKNLSSGIAMEQSGLITVHDQTKSAVASALPRVMNGGGLIGVLGGARVKCLVGGTHEVLLPMPQLTESQIPVCYAVVTIPQGAVKEIRLYKREEANMAVRLQFQGNQDEEVQIEWSSIILVVDTSVAPNDTVSKPYLQETACVQSNAEQVRTLAEKLWPANGRTDAYAANIQKFIQNMKQEKQPRSMDALGILESGCNWICTGNANLATALLRSKKVPARSIAVIPSTGQKLEMHRIVECFDAGQWHSFDPSFLQRDIPLKPWQNIIMATTTIADEEIAMKPRMGSSLGCPYGQELEILTGKVTLWGTDFFWTQAVPIAEFKASDEAITLAKAQWHRFLETGEQSQGQLNAAAAANSAELQEALKMN